MEILNIRILPNNLLDVDNSTKKKEGQLRSSLLSFSIEYVKRFWFNLQFFSIMLNLFTEVNRLS